MKKIRALTAALLSSVLLVTACGGASQETTVSEETTQEETSEEITQEETSEETTQEETSEETIQEETSEESTQEETTEAETQTEENTEKQDAALSDDLYSFAISFEGDICQLPMSYQDFTALGWVYDGDESQQLESRAGKSTQVFARDNERVYADLTNFDVNAAPITDSYVTKIYLDDTMISPSKSDIELPGGIVYGKSTLDDATAAYGTSTREYKSTNYTTETYTQDTNQEVELMFNVGDNVLWGISVENISEPSDMEYSEVSSEVPTIVGNYKTPEVMSFDPSDFVVDFAGDLYQLPAPVSVFEANGWEIQEDDSQANVEGTGYGWVTLMKDNQQLRAIAVNYSDNAASIENCFVTSVKASSSEYEDCNVDMTIFNGITIGMDWDALESAIGDTPYELQEGMATTTYIIEPVSDKLNCYSVTVNGGTELVETIEVDNRPKQEDFRQQLGTE
ncbi:MAG: hypothetical protein SOI56_07500 [Eubacteriales bacterium]|jgi:hypothetical protein